MLLQIKWVKMVEINYKDFLTVFPVIPRQNVLWTMGLKMYGEEKTKILLSSGTLIDPGTQGPG